MCAAERGAARSTGEPELEGDEGDPPGHDVGAVDDWGRRLDRRETVFWYGLAGVTYVVASIFQKGLLNWFAGPMWLVAVVWLGPLLTDRVRHRRRTPPPQAGPDVEAGGPAAP